MAAPSSAPHQMQVRVTFYTSHNPQSVLMILKNEQALQQITEKARELFPSADYRLFYGDVNGPIYEFTDSEQVMSKIRITTFSRTPQLFVRLESGSTCSSSTKKPSRVERESKSGAYLKRIEQNQELTLKTIEKLQKELERVSALETMVADIQSKGSSIVSDKESITRPFPPAKHSASCDACLGDIIGHRYKCLQCADYDLCEKCEKKSVHYEHALVRIVHPNKTSIPSYVTRNSPNNVFPLYMQNGNRAGDNIPDVQMILEQLSKNNILKSRIIHPTAPVAVPVPPSAPAAAPAPAPVKAPAPAAAPFSGPEARLFNEETCAALMNGASILKDTFTTLSKSFMDLADGAQANMEKKIIERSTMEAGVKKVEEKVDNLKRHCEEKVFGIPAPEAEKVVDSSKKSTESTTGPKIKKAKKKSVYKKVAERVDTMGLVAAVAEDERRSREEAKKRAAASTADLQRKLAELNFKPAVEELRAINRVVPSEDEPLVGSLEAIMKAILNRPSDLSTTPLVETNPPIPSIYPVVPTAPIDSLTQVEQPFSSTAFPSGPIVEIGKFPLPGDKTKQLQDEQSEERMIPLTTTPISIHSSFENISSDFESLSPSFGDYQVMEIPEPRTEETDDLLEFSDVVDVPEVTQTQEVAQTVDTARQDSSSLPRLDSETEKTFDRLLEMGFDYNVAVAAVREHGSNLEQCLFSLLQ